MNWEEFKINLRSLSAEKRQAAFEELSSMDIKDFQELWTVFCADSFKPVFKQMNQMLDEMEGEENEEFKD
jgi:hypothetical protein